MKWEISICLCLFLFFCLYTPHVTFWRLLLLLLFITLAVLFTSAFFVGYTSKFCQFPRLVRFFLSRWEWLSTSEYMWELTNSNNVKLPHRTVTACYRCSGCATTETNLVKSIKCPMEPCKFHRFFSSELLQICILSLSQWNHLFGPPFGILSREANEMDDMNICKQQYMVSKPR